MRDCSSTLWLLLSLLILVPAAGADEPWPGFRGPLGQGHGTATNLPVSWSREEHITWRTELAGEGWSSPVVAQGKIFLTAAKKLPAPQETAESASTERARAEEEPKEEAELPKRKQHLERVGYSLQALCYSATTGEQLWSRELFVEPADAPRIHDKNSHASPTPLVSGDRLFIHFAHLGTACLDLAGKVLWQNQELRYQPVHGGGCSPVLVDGLLVFTADGSRDPSVIALDAATGALRWKFVRTYDVPKKFAFCTPLVIDVAGKLQIIAPGAGGVSALNPVDGTEIWRVDYGQGYSVVPRPVYAHGLVFLSSGYDTPELLAIRPDGAGNVTETHVAWRTKKGAPNTPSMLVIGDELYFVSDRGVASCVDARTGEPHWVERLGGSFSSSPVFADGKLFFVNETGEGTVIAPGRTFTPLGKNNLGERTLASYAIAHDALFIRTEQALYRVEAR